jgi:hypothetical protein
LIRPSLLVTVPPVNGLEETIKVKLLPPPPDVEKVAVTVVAAVIVTVQVLVPEHPPPDQPVKVYPLFGEAVKVTDVPEL